MKNREILFLLGGIAIGYLVFRPRTQVIEVVQLGDKSKNVEKLQKLLKLEPTGVYCKQTKKKAVDVLNGTKVLTDSERGAINKDFIEGSAHLMNLN